MPWNVPISVNDRSYDVSFEKEPNDQDIADAVEHLKDPERGQPLSEGIQSGLARGFEEGLTATFVSGPGAIGEAVGFKDNALLKTGRQMESDIEARNPLSQENQQSYPVQAAQAIGQAASMAVTAPLAGANVEFKAASMFGKARQIALIGGLAGASAGEQEAVRIGVTDPLAKAGMILGTGAIEFGSELLGGFTTEMAPFRALTGKAGPAVGFIKHSLVEGGEEIAAGVPERELSKLMAKQDPNRPGFTVEGQPIYNAWDVGQVLQEGSLGTIAGGALVAAHHVLAVMTPQQQQDTKNVAHLPGPLRKQAYEDLQKVTANEAVATSMGAGLGDETNANLRAAHDGKRVNVLNGANKEAAAEFAPGWQEREKANLVHTGEDFDAFFQGGQWVAPTDQKTPEGQPIFAPAPNIAELEAARQEFIKTGDMPEQMQPLQAAPAAPAITFATWQDAARAIDSEILTMGVEKATTALNAAVDHLTNDKTVPPDVRKLMLDKAARMRGGLEHDLALKKAAEAAGRQHFDVNGWLAPDYGDQGMGTVTTGDVLVKVAVDGNGELDPAHNVDQQGIFVNRGPGQAARVRIQSKGGMAPLMFTEAGLQQEGLTPEKTGAEPVIKKKVPLRLLTPEAKLRAVDTILNEMDVQGRPIDDKAVANIAKNLGMDEGAVRARINPSATTTPQTNEIPKGPENQVAPPNSVSPVVGNAAQPQAAGEAAQGTPLGTDQGAQGAEVAAPEPLAVPQPAEVAQKYPHSPDLVQRLEAADSPAAAAVILKEGEPVAQLREELAAKTPMQVADDLRAANVPEVTVAKVTEGGPVDVVAAADLISAPVMPNVTAEAPQPEVVSEDLVGPVTARVQPAEFEARLREKIRNENLTGWTENQIKAAVYAHGKPVLPNIPPSHLPVIAEVNREMRAPSEVREESRQQRQDALQIAQEQVSAAAPPTAPVAGTPPVAPTALPGAALAWALQQIEKGDINAGLNPTLLAAHAIRSADWILTNGRNFGKWAGEQISRFGDGIRGSLRRIWSAATEFLRQRGTLPALTPEAETARMTADEPAVRVQRRQATQSRRDLGVARTVESLGRAAGVEIATHSEADTPVVSVVPGAAPAVSVHERYAAAVAALNGQGRVEELSKLASFLSLQKAIAAAATAPVPAWLPDVTPQELLLREVGLAMAPTTPELRSMWNIGLEIMMGRPFASEVERESALGQLQADLATDPMVGQLWTTHLLRLAAERQSGKLAEERGGLFASDSLWEQRMGTTFDDFLARARAAEYGPDVQRVLAEAATAYRDAAPGTVAAMTENALIDRQIQREADQEIHVAGEAELGARASSPYRTSIQEAAQRMRDETDVRFVTGAHEVPAIPEIVNGAPFGVDAEGNAVVALDHVHVTLDDRRKAEKAGTTAGEQALRRVVADAEAATVDPKQRLARAMTGDVVNAMQSTLSWAPFVDALWNECGPELQQMVAGSTTEARGEQARTDSPSYDEEQRATRVRDRDQAATAWLHDNFGPQMQQVLAGEREVSEPLTSLAGPFAKATEDYVRENLQAYQGTAPVRYSAQQRGVITPAQDAAYLDAVSRGYMDSAAAMVAQGAKGAGYTHQFWRGAAEDQPSDEMHAIYLSKNKWLAGTFNEAGEPKKYFVKADNILDADSEVRGPVAKSSALTKEEVERIKKAGYDAVEGEMSGPGGHEIAVFSPSQIKSAETVTRDDEGKVIPLSQRFNPASNDIRYSTQGNQPRVISRNVTLSEIATAQKGLAQTAPAAAAAWKGTRAQLNAYLLGDAPVRNQWEAAWRARTENSAKTVEEAQQAFKDWVEAGLDGVEGFLLAGRSYIIADQVFVYDTDGSGEMAARRVLLHEDAHDVLEYARDVIPGFNAEWERRRNSVPAAELDALVPLYPWTAGWRSDSRAHDEIFHEWIAAKTAEIEYRGVPSPDSLFGQILQWLKDAWKSIVGNGLEPSNQQILDFVDAARRAKWSALNTSSQTGFRYSVNSDGDTSARQAVDGDVDAGANWTGAPLETQRAATQVYGEFPGMSHIVQSIEPMSQFARFWTGGVNDEPAALTAENTATVKQLTQEFLSDPDFANNYIANFQEWFGSRYPEAGPHRGDAAVGLLQAELMDYAARMAAANGDSSLMTKLLSVANDVPMGGTTSVAASARTVGARGHVTQNTIFKVLKDFLVGGAEAASKVDRLGPAVAEVTTNKDGTRSVELGPLAASVDPTLNPDLEAEIALGMDDYATSDSIDSEADAFDQQAEEFEPDAHRDIARSLLDKDVRAMDVRLEQVMIRLAELEMLRRAQKARAGSAAKASMSAEDRNRFATDPAALDAEIASLTAEATDLLQRITKSKTSHETKEKRRARINDPKVAAAVKVLSQDEKAKKFLERYKERNKRVRREKEPWQALLEDQIRSPKDEDVFRSDAVEQGIEVETADRVFEAAAQIRAEQKAKLKPKMGPARDIENERKIRQERKTKTELERYYAQIEKSEGKEAAAQARMATQRAKAQAKASNQSVVDAQRAEQQRQQQEQRQAEKTQAEMEKYYADIEKAEGKQAAMQQRLADQRTKAQTRAENQAQARAQRQEQKDAAREARDAERKAEEAARELNKVQREAEGIIDSLATQFSDTPKWNKSTPSKLRELRRQFRERVIDRKAFTAGVRALNVNQQTTEQLANLTEEEQRRQDVVAAARQRMAEEERLQSLEGPTYGPKPIGKPRLSYRDLVSFVGRAIARSPLAQQGDPEWVKETFIAAFQDMGFPRDVAEGYAKKITARQQSILKEGQMKEMEKSAKRLSVKKMTQQLVGNFMRTQVFDPMISNPVIAALMQKAGYAKMSKEDFQKLAKLDEAINSGFPTLAADAFTQVQRILRQIRPMRHWNPLKEGSVWPQMFVNGALSSLGVTGLNWIHAGYIMPRRFVTDLGAIMGDAIVGAGKGGRDQNLLLMANMFTNLWAARENFLNQAIHSLKSDSYKGRMLEMLNTEHELYTELMAEMKKVTSGGAMERTLAIPKIAWLSSDWVRRMLASADQTWGSVIERYVIRNEAMRMMVQDAGMTVEGAALVVQRAVEEGAAKATELQAAGEDPRKASLVGEDQMMSSLATSLDGMKELQRGKMTGGKILLQTSAKEKELELGNRRGEKGRSWDIPNVLLEGFKSAASAVRNQTELLGRPLTGFVSVGANLLNRSFYFTPLGAMRVLAKSRMNEAEREKFYTETMATQGQMRARLYESIAGTVALMVLEIFRWRPDKKEWGIMATGNGPATPGLRDAWYKQGHGKGRLELLDPQGNVMFGVSYTRGGFDHLAVPLTFAGAHSDMELEGKRSSPKNVDWAWAYSQTVMGNMAKQAQFFGAKALFGGVPTSTKPHALAGLVAYNVQPFLPWGGLQRSVWKMVSGPTEEGSWRSAISSNIPVAQVFLGTPKPAINFLGDQLGNQPTEDWKKMLERGFTGAGVPPFLVALDPTPPNERIYDFLMRKGVSPTMPLRSYLENKNGFLTDDKWYKYIQTRGKLIKTSLLSEMPRLNGLKGRDLEREISNISSDATKEAKAKLGLQ